MYSCGERVYQNLAGAPHLAMPTTVNDDGETCHDLSVVPKWLASSEDVRPLIPIEGGRMFCPKPWELLCRSCWLTQPMQRPSAKQVCQLLQLLEGSEAWARPKTFGATVDYCKMDGHEATRCLMEKLGMGEHVDLVCQYVQRDSIGLQILLEMLHDPDPVDMEELLEEMFEDNVHAQRTFCAELEQTTAAATDRERERREPWSCLKEWMLRPAPLIGGGCSKKLVQALVDEKPSPAEEFKRGARAAGSLGKCVRRRRQAQEAAARAELVSENERLQLETRTPAAADE
jgi:hypothetical protein